MHDSSPTSNLGVTKFLIVTPTFNAPEFLDEVIDSVVSQQGEFDLYYHVQDGQSRDHTMDIVRTWEERVRTNPGQRARLNFTWASEPDRSMYDAIQKGFDRLLRTTPLGEGDLVVMTWINSDDRFMPNAFHTVASFLREHPGEDWVTGLPCVIREDGCIADVRLEGCGYSRIRLLKGQYDGRNLPFVMQEGTFWTLPLWRQAGGLNVALRFAGDWDLWRRMARAARLVNLRAVLGYHRRRPGQLSSDLTNYWKEVDALLEETQAEDAALARSLKARDEDQAWLAAWSIATRAWKLYPGNYRTRRREGFFRCLSDCLVESWSQYRLGRALIRLYRRARGIELE